MVREMNAADFDWAADLMDRRRQQYAQYSPVFWRPAKDVAAGHADFLRATCARPGAVALRTDGGFAMSTGNDGRCFVDDFAVEDADLWATEGRELLLAVWAAARSDDQRTLRAVTARRDEPKRDLLAGLGLEVAARWWIKELEPTGDATTWGPVTLGAATALIMPAPPVYDPVVRCACWATSRASRPAPRRTQPRRTAPSSPSCSVSEPRRGPASDPVLEVAGFHNPSEFYGASRSGRRSSPAGIEKDRQRRTSMWQVGPGLAASLASAVSKGTPISSAKATYTAS